MNDKYQEFENMVEIMPEDVDSGLLPDDIDPGIYVDYRALNRVVFFNLNMIANEIMNRELCGPVSVDEIKGLLETRISYMSRLIDEQAKRKWGFQEGELD